jgi:o-succinylbenzoate synthase
MDVNRKITVQKHLLPFRFSAGTSRGIMQFKKLWIIRFEQNGRVGKGECSIIEDLTPEYNNDEAYEQRIKDLMHRLQTMKESPLQIFQELLSRFPELEEQPSVRCGIEMALLDWLNPDKEVVFDNDFTRGKTSIPINGLIWMGDIAWMQEQVEEKLVAGFNVLKFKIAALDWQEEWSFLDQIRQRFPASKLTIRLDANGGFNPQNAVSRLTQLRSLDIHSIEQPVAPEYQQTLTELSKLNLVPVALDESLIACFTSESKRQLLSSIRPQYIILKPSLHGGFSGVQEWISMAEDLGIGWWMTSALESNIGLKAIAQFAASYPLSTTQGLGTGGLFTQNFPTNLELKGPNLYHHLPEQGDISTHVE